MNKVYLGIGSNVGEREDNIVRALTLIDESDSVTLKACSSIYETKPYGIKEQSNFLNCVVYIETEFLPEFLLKYLKNIEVKTGRKKTFRWGPRVIDVDILYFNDIVYDSENLLIPHHDLLNRDFFIVPLLELNKNIGYPGTNKKLVDMVSSSIPRNIIDKIKFNPLI